MELKSSSRLNRALELVRSVRAMPKVSISFHESTPVGATLTKSREVYKYFTKPHRYFVVRNKTVGVALVDLEDYSDFQSYLKSVNGKNNAAYYARKAEKRLYSFSTIERNEFKDDIYEINNSAENRQGRKMKDTYLAKETQYENMPGYKYFGVVNSQGKLVAYCNVTFYGEFALIPQLLGHSDYLNDGIMYYMLTEVLRDLYDSQPAGNCRYLMYDTFLGSSLGLQKFKRKLGFKPYRVKWKWNWNPAPKA